MSNIKIMRDSWTGKGTAAPVARALNKAGRCVNGIRVEGGGNVQKFGNNIVIPRTISTGISFAKFCFGFTISGATVTIKAGEVQWGTSVFGIGQTDIAIAEDLQYIGIEATYDSAVLIGPDSNLATFRSTADIIRTWLYQFNWTAPSKPEGTPTVSLLRVGKTPGNWIISSEFSPQ